MQEADDIAGQKVLTAYARVHPLGWFVFVETPIEEAYAPLYRSIQRSGYVLLGALALAFIAGTFLARRMVVPIQALRAGAARIGAGDLAQRIDIKTGDEVEALANQFNDMAGRLQESYADLEKKVEDRTAELTEALAQQTATSEVLRVNPSSRGELEPIFNVILASAIGCAKQPTARCTCAKTTATGPPRAKAHLPASAEQIGGGATSFSRGPTCPSAAPYPPGRPVLVADWQPAGLSRPRSRDGCRRRPRGHRSMFAMPMLKDDELVGVVAFYRREVRPFTESRSRWCTNFAAQAVIAIENTRLLSELRQRTDDLSPVAARNCAPRRTAWCRPRNLLRSAN